MATETRWEPADEALARLAASLKRGEMVAIPEFDSGKAIAAVEFFSAKMDAGMAGVPKQPDAWTAEEREAVVRAVADDADVCAELVARLWWHETAHLWGAAVAESLMTCVLAHPAFQPTLESLAKASPACATLRALVLASIGLCQSAMRAVFLGNIAFDEDYISGTAGLELPPVEPAALVDVLTAALANEKRELFKTMLEARLAIAKAEVAYDAAKADVAAAAVDVPLGAAKDALARLVGLLGDHANAATPTSADDDERLATIFVPTLNYWRLSPAPPRKPTPPTPWKPLPAVERLAAVVASHLAIGTIKRAVQAEFDLVAKHDRVGSVLVALVEALQDYMATPRDALSRSRCAAALTDSKTRIMGVIEWTRAVELDIKVTGAGTAKILNHEEVKEAQIPVAAAGLLHDAIHTLCMNRARARRRLVHRLEELGGFQQRCEACDYVALGHTTPFADTPAADRQRTRDALTLPLGNWATSWCLRLMLLFLEFGTELGLYHPREAPILAYFYAGASRVFFHLVSLGLRMRMNLPPNSTPEQNQKAYDAMLAKLTPSFERMYELVQVRRLHSAATAATLAVMLASLLETHPTPPNFDARKHFEHRLFDPFSTVWLPKPMDYSSFTMFVQETRGAITPLELAENLKQVQKVCQEIVKHPHVAEHAPTLDAVRDVARNTLVNALACNGYVVKEPNRKGKLVVEMPTRGGPSLVVLKFVKP